MLLPNAASIFAFLLLPFYATTSAVASQNALTLIEAQSDLTLIAALIKRDPVLVELYSTATDVTIVAAVDSSFTSTDPNNPIYSNRAAVRAILQDIVIRGLYPTSAITKNPIYPSTELTNPRFVDTSRGRAASKLVEINGKKTVDVGSGTRANIVQGVRVPLIPAHHLSSFIWLRHKMLIHCQNLRFSGGILHKVGNGLNTPASFLSIASTLNILSISELSGITAAVFELITSARDTTLFSVGYGPSGLPANITVEEFIDVLAGYVVTPGVYFEKDFTGKTVKALNGDNLRLSGFGTGKVKVNGANVIRSDIFSTNGVLHVLDRYV